jgi:hypothetical protein
MFSKLSRYSKVANVVIPDAQGQLLSVKDLRPLPQVTGTFRHMVKAGDRLDQLSYKYYSQSLQWWRICDANPEILSPLALLGDDVIVTTRFHLTVAGVGMPTWDKLFVTLYDVLGVERVQMTEHVGTMQEQRLVDDQTITVVEEKYLWEVRVTYNRLNVTYAVLAERMKESGFIVGEITEMGQLGKEIIIPPKGFG